jgi:hypothetical protein
VPRSRPVTGENTKVEERGYGQTIYTVILPFRQKRRLVGMEIQHKGTTIGLAKYQKQDRETVVQNPILILKE